MRILPRIRLLPTVATVLSVACSSAPPYQGLQPEEIFQIASREYDEGDYDNAIRALDRLLVAYGDWPRIPEARLLMGHARYGNEEFLIARSEYNRFLDRYPAHQGAPAAALGICRSLAAMSPNPQRDQAYTQDAMVACRNAVLDYRGTPEAQQAADLANEMRVKLAESEFLRAEFYRRRKLFDSAIRYYEFVVEGYAETTYAPRALLGIYRTNLQIGYEDLAEEARQRLLNEYPDSPAAEEVRANGAGA